MAAKDIIFIDSSDDAIASDDEAVVEGMFVLFLFLFFSLLLLILCFVLFCPAPPPKKRKLVRKTLPAFPSTVTITFGDQAENHVGMQKIGELADSGFSIEELMTAKKKFEEAGAECELTDLTLAAPKDLDMEHAAILVVRRGVNVLLSSAKATADEAYKEQIALEYDKKARMYGRVVNKHARWNLCFDEQGQEPDYEAGKGRIVAYKDVPLTAHVRNTLPMFLGDKAKNLTGEGNLYYDTKTTGIGFHGSVTTFSYEYLILTYFA